MGIEFVLLRITISFFNLKDNRKYGYLRNLVKMENMKKLRNLMLIKYIVVVVDGFKWNIRNKIKCYYVKMEIVLIYLKLRMIIH